MAKVELSYQDIQELLHQRGIVVSHETLRKWCTKFGPLFGEELRHREPRRGSVRLIVPLVDEAQGWPELQATPAPTSRHT